MVSNIDQRYKSALIGSSGLIGKTLLKQRNFDDLYRSTNINEIKNKSYDMIICAGAPSIKWIANKYPEEDWHNIKNLIFHLSTVQAKQFILISTVDVFKNPVQTSESTPVDTSKLHAYGLHRFRLEEFVKNHFSHSVIVRLSGLVGPGLKKNIIYDFMNHNNLSAIDSRGVFQFYPIVNLWSDVKVALENKCPLLHLTSEPLQVSDIVKECFYTDFENILSCTPAAYDFQSEFSHLYGSKVPYQYTKKDIFLATRSYIQAEIQSQ